MSTQTLDILNNFCNAVFLTFKLVCGQTTRHSRLIDSRKRSLLRWDAWDLHSKYGGNIFFRCGGLVDRKKITYMKFLHDSTISTHQKSLKSVIQKYKVDVLENTVAYNKIEWHHVDYRNCFIRLHFTFQVGLNINLTQNRENCKSNLQI